MTIPSEIKTPMSKKLCKKRVKLIIDFHKQYENPIKLLIKKRPSLYNAARGMGMTNEEVIQACWSGVVRAAQLYRWDKGASFATFATYWLRNGVNAEVTKRHRWNRELLVFWNGTESEDSSKLLHFGSILESNDADPSEGETQEVLTERFLRHLSTRESYVIRRRFGIDSGYTETLEEIAKDMKVTKERVRQIQNRALDKMRRRECPDAQ